MEERSKQKETNQKCKTNKLGFERKSLYLEKSHINSYTS